MQITNNLENQISPLTESHFNFLRKKKYRSRLQLQLLNDFNFYIEQQSIDVCAGKFKSRAQQIVDLYQQKLEVSRKLLCTIQRLFHLRVKYNEAIALQTRIENYSLFIQSLDSNTGGNDLKESDFLFNSNLFKDIDCFSQKAYQRKESLKLILIQTKAQQLFHYYTQQINKFDTKQFNHKRIICLKNDYELAKVFNQRIQSYSLSPLRFPECFGHDIPFLFICYLSFRDMYNFSLVNKDCNHLADQFWERKAKNLGYQDNLAPNVHNKKNAKRYLYLLQNALKQIPSDQIKKHFPDFDHALDLESKCAQLISFNWEQEQKPFQLLLNLNFREGISRDLHYLIAILKKLELKDYQLNKIEHLESFNYIARKNNYFLLALSNHSEKFIFLKICYAGTLEALQFLNYSIEQLTTWINEEKSFLSDLYLRQNDLFCTDPENKVEIVNWLLSIGLVPKEQDFKNLLSIQNLSKQKDKEKLILQFLKHIAPHNQLKAYQHCQTITLSYSSVKLNKWLDKKIALLQKIKRN